MNDLDCNPEPQAELKDNTSLPNIMSSFSCEEVTGALLAMDTRKSTEGDTLDAVLLIAECIVFPTYINCSNHHSLENSMV